MTDRWPVGRTDDSYINLDTREVMYPVSDALAERVRAIVPTPDEMSAECMAEIRRHVRGVEFVPLKRLWHTTWLGPETSGYKRQKVYGLLPIANEDVPGAEDHIRSTALALARQFGNRIAEFASNQLLETTTVRVWNRIIVPLARWGDSVAAVLGDPMCDQCVMHYRAMFVVMPHGEEWVPSDD